MRISLFSPVLSFADRLPGDVACRLQFDISLQIVKIEIMEEILESGRRRYLAPAVAFCGRGRRVFVVRCGAGNSRFRPADG